MALNVLQSNTRPTDADLVRLFHRTELHRARQVGEDAEREWGTAIASGEWPGVAEANQVLNLGLPAGMDAAAVLAAADGAFTARKSACLRYVINPSVDAKQREALSGALAGRGLVERRETICYLRKMNSVAPTGQGLSVIPARAGLRLARRLAEEQYGQGAQAEVRLARLDDPHGDELLVLKEGRGLAIGGLLTVGELGRIDDLFVAADVRRRGVGRGLLAGLLEICARALLRHVFVKVAEENVAATALVKSFGFEPVGEFVWWEMPNSRA